MNASAILSARSLRKTYSGSFGTFEALRGVSLDILEGESLAITGKSGSGKSTLMHLLALLDEPSGGTILLDGLDTQDIKRKRLDQIRNKTFGFVFQHFYLTGNQTVLENVMLPLKIAGIGAKACRERGMRCLADLELDDKAKNRAQTLSGGQKQRVAIARALVGSPRIIFADEPTGNLDSVTGKVVENILFDLNREEGLALVIVTHDDDLAARCDRRIHIKDGQVLRSDAEGVAA